VTASRARSFGAAAAEYARYRPEYAEAAIDRALEPVIARPALRLLDLAAGTGKLTGALLRRGSVIAVEPDPAMLAELRARFPEGDAREGSAEAIPVPAGSVDAVLVGQAWHWFDAQRALPEIGRVLRPGGVLAALWNGDDPDVEWVAGYREAAGIASRMRADDGLRLPEHPDFGRSEHSAHPNPVRTTVESLIAMLATHSWSLVAEPAEREAAFARVRAYLATRPETSAGEFELPLVTDVVRVLRR
jgi:SAM-dependent methyltransferase